MNRTGIRSTVRAVVTLATQRELSFLAGGVAFFAFFSLLPLLLLVLAVGSAVGGEAFATQIVSLVEAYLSEEGETVVDEALADGAGAVGFSVVSIVALLWSALKVFRAIDVAFDRIYQVEARTSLPRQLFNALVVLVAIGVGVALLVAVQPVTARLAADAGLSPRLIGVALTAAGLAVVFAPIYYVMPPVSIRLREVIPGTVGVVVGLLVLQQVFQVYAAQAGQYQAYGIIGAVLLFLLWLYFGSMILLGGVILNAAFAGRAPREVGSGRSEGESPRREGRTEDAGDREPGRDEEEPPRIT